MPKNHSTITCKKGAKILPTFSCIVRLQLAVSLKGRAYATNKT